jgi:glutamine amidotransferase/cyclase
MTDDEGKMRRSSSLTVSLLDYGAGNVRSVRNAITACGYRVVDVTDPRDVTNAEVLIFPGVGSYHSAMETLAARGYDAALREYLVDDRPYLGICLGMQTLFDGSDERAVGDGESSPLPGLGIIPGRVVRFDEDGGRRSVPHIGWNGIVSRQKSPATRHVDGIGGREVYFVHSYYAPITTENECWVLTSTNYEGQEYVSSIQRGNVVATQFHPEKSGGVGLDFLRGFLEVSLGPFGHSSALLIFYHLPPSSPRPPRLVVV